MSMFRRPSLLLLWLVLASGLASCGLRSSAPTPTPAPTSTATPAAPVELIVWAENFTQETMSTDPAGAGRYGWYLKEQFEKEHPGVTVTIQFQGWDEMLRQNLFNALLAGTAPDVVVGENFFQYFGELGALVPLDDAIADIKPNLIPGTYKAAEFQGHVYGLSSFTGVFGFERNCQVITAAGLDCGQPPASWDELLRQAQLITEQGKGKYYGYTLQGPVESSVGAPFRVAVYLAQAGATLCQNDCTTPYFNDPKAVPVMEFLRAINQYTPPGLTFNPNEGQVYEQLFRGQSAYQIAGSWHPQWAKDTGCEDCRYSALPLPKGGQPASLVVGNVIYAVLQQGRHPGLGVEWVKFLARDDVQDLVYPTLGRLPTTRSALTKLRATAPLADQAFIDQLLNNPSLEILPQWRQAPQQLWGIYNMLTEVLTTERPIQEIMDKAQLDALEAVK